MVPLSSAPFHLWTNCSAALNWTNPPPAVAMRSGPPARPCQERLQNANVGFADAFLAAGAAEERVAVASFDRDFDKLKMPRYEPVA